MVRGKSTERDRSLTIIEQGLTTAGYLVNRDAQIGDFFGVKNRKINMLAINRRGTRHFITSTGQTNSGTTAEKIPFGAMALVDLARRSKPQDRFHLVLYGNGWKYKRFFLGGMANFLIDIELVNIVSFEIFIEAIHHRRL